jgi:HEAT repeat protein
VVLSGNLDDADVRRVLTYVISNGEKFDPGVRLDCLDALRERTSDASVRRALLAAARKDQNPAVRMKALEALRDSASDPDVRDVLVDALNHDTNPGVRVEAVNLLVRSLENASVADSETDQEDAQGGVAPVTSAPDSSMARVIRALQELQRHDPNRYVRLRSAAALRQIGPQELQ